MLTWREGYRVPSSHPIITRLKLSLSFIRNTEMKKTGRMMSIEIIERLLHASYFIAFTEGQGIPVLFFLIVNKIVVNEIDVIARCIYRCCHIKTSLVSLFVFSHF